MKQMQIVIVPNPSATTEQLRALGQAIAEWTDVASGDRYQLTATNAGLRDLLQGELPQPLALEVTRRPGELASQQERLGESASLRCVCLSADGHGFTREEVVSSIKEFFCDPGAVAQVFVDGDGWNVK